MLLRRARSEFCSIKGNQKSNHCQVLFRKYTSWACLLRSGLNCIFHRKPQLNITCRSLLNSLCDVYLSRTLKEKVVSSAKILQLDLILSVKPSMYSKNMRSPRANPCRTPEFLYFQEEILGTLFEIVREDSYEEHLILLL